MKLIDWLFSTTEVPNWFHLIGSVAIGIIMVAVIMVVIICISSSVRHYDDE